MDDLGIMNIGVLLWGEYFIDIVEKEKLVIKVLFFFWIFIFKNWIFICLFIIFVYIFVNFYDFGIFVYGFKL